MNKHRQFCGHEIYFYKNSISYIISFCKGKEKRAMLTHCSFLFQWQSPQHRWRKYIPSLWCSNSVDTGGVGEIWTRVLPDCQKAFYTLMPQLSYGMPLCGRKSIPAEIWKSAALPTSHQNGSSPPEWRPHPPDGKEVRTNRLTVD